MSRVIPQALKKGDMIGLVSPSSPIMKESLETGINYLEQKGFKLALGNHINRADRFLAGTDDERAKDIMDFFINPKIKAIIATRGGQGSQRLLPLLEYEVIEKNPKLLIGFSDTTALQLGLLKKIGLVTYTGFTLTVELTALLDQTLMSCLMGEPYQITSGTSVQAGMVSGPLVGGNLTLTTTLLGTPYQPDFKGCILLIEDVGVEPYNIDRMLSQLDLAGVYEQVTGIIFGQFENCVSENSSGGLVEDVINEWSKRFKIPCLKNFTYGHGDKNCVLPIGKDITLDATESMVSIN